MAQMSHIDGKQPTFNEGERLNQLVILGQITSKFYS